MKKRRFDLSYKVSADSDFMLETILNSPELCRLIDVPTVFFSSGGTSSSDEARNKDWMNICHKYSLIYKRKNIKNLSVDLVKVLLKKLRIYDKFMCRFESWKVHSCDNENCRWCN